MNARQVSVVGAVIVVLLGLLYFEGQRINAPQTEAFAPAQSAEEEVPVADTPIEPPAALTETQATAEGEGAADSMASADAVPAEETSPFPAEEMDAEQAMDAPAAAETEPDTPALAEMEAEPEPVAHAEEAPAMAASEPDVTTEGLERQTPAVEPGEMASEDAEPEEMASEDAEPETPANEMAAAEPVVEAPALDRQTPAVEPDETATADDSAATPQADAADGAAAVEPDTADGTEPAMEEAATADTAAAAASEMAPEESSEADTAMAAPEEAADDAAAADAGTAEEEQPSTEMASGEAEAAATTEAPAETSAMDEDAGSAAAAEPEGDQPTMMAEGTTETEAASTGPSESDEVQIAVVEPDAQEATPVEGAMGEPGAVPSFDVVRVESTGDAVVAGQAEPGSMVEIMDGADVIASAASNERGEWAIVLDQPLPPGTHDLAVRATSEDKSAVNLSEQRVAVSVPEQETEEALVVLNSPDAPSRILQMPATVADETDVAMAGDSASEAEDQASGETETAMTPTSEADGSAPMSAVTSTAETEMAEAGEETPAEPATGPQVGVAAVEADTAGSLFVAGTAETDETVRVYVDDEFVGEAEPSESGTWLVETQRELPEGTYSVRVDQVEESSGTVIARAEVPFEREIEVASLKPVVTTSEETTTEVAAAVPAPETVIIRRGDNLWRIARRLYGRGIRYSTIYQANKDQIRNPHWIYPGQVFMLPEGDTNWQN